MATFFHDLHTRLDVLVDGMIQDLTMFFKLSSATMVDELPLIMAYEWQWNSEFVTYN